MRHRERQRSRDGARGAELPGRLAAPCKRRDFAGSLRRAVARRVCSNLRNYVANTPKRLVFGKRGRAFRSPPPSCPTPMLAPGNPAEPQGSWPSLRGRAVVQLGPDNLEPIESLTARSIPYLLRNQSTELVHNSVDKPRPGKQKCRGLLALSGV